MDEKWMKSGEAAEKMKRCAPKTIRLCSVCNKKTVEKGIPSVYL